MIQYSLIQISERAVELVFANKIDIQQNKAIQKIAQKLFEQYDEQVTVIPAYHTLTVTFDVAKISFQELAHKIKTIAENISVSDNQIKTIVELPVCYDTDFGPDLQDVAAFAKVSVDELIKLHTSTDYFIFMMGFLPGFAYMGSVPEQIAMPRLETPRSLIAPGSVGLAGAQTGMYPVQSPGGWRILGRTPIKLYDPKNPEPYYKVGQYVRFVPISRKRFDEIKELDQNNLYQLKIFDERLSE